jgi:hypothetical protein
MQRERLAGLVGWLVGQRKGLTCCWPWRVPLAAALKHARRGCGGSKEARPTGPRPAHLCAEPELDPLPAPPADIAPGKPGLTPLPFEPAEWQAFSLVQPPDAAAARRIYDLGRADAAAWARGVGLAQAAAAAAGGAAARRGVEA